MLETRKIALLFEFDSSKPEVSLDQLAQKLRECADMAEKGAAAIRTGQMWDWRGLEQ